MARDFGEVIDRRGTGSSKWSRYPGDVLPLWVADMDFAAAPEIVAALAERLAHPVFGYCVARPELRERIVEDMARNYGWSIRPEDVVFLPGVEPGFNMAIRALLEPGQALAIQSPIYAPIRKAPAHWNLEAVHLPVDVPFADQTAALARADAVLLCNPHNPTGKVYGRSELADLAAATGDRPIISDEIHCELLFDGNRHVPIASLDSSVEQRTITLMSAAKTYNIAGLKAAFAIVPNRVLRERFDGARLGLVDSVNVFGLEAALAAFRDGGRWKAEMLAYLQSNRDWLVEALRSELPGIRMEKPQATFLAWLDCTALGLADPHEHFLRKARVGLSAGADFGAAYGQFVRLNFGCPRPLLVEAIERMAASL